jgi:hypothetical protein
MPFRNVTPIHFDEYLFLGVSQPFTFNLPNELFY